MRKTIEITETDWGHSGIRVTWTKSGSRLDISAWSDSCVGIEGKSFTLSEFLSRLGITEKDLAKAIAAMRKKGVARE